MGEFMLAGLVIILILIIVYIHKNEEKEKYLNLNCSKLKKTNYKKKFDLHDNKQGRRISNESAQTKYWDVSSQYKDSNVRLKENMLSPHKRLQYDVGMVNNKEKNLNLKDIGKSLFPTPNYNNKVVSNPYSLFSGENQKNYDHIFRNNMDNNNKNQQNMNNLNSFKPCGSNFNNGFNNFNNNTSNNINKNNNFNFEANNQMNVKIIKAEEYIKKTIYSGNDISPLIKTIDLDSNYLDYFNPSLAKYNNQEEVNKNIAREDPKTLADNLGEFYPKKLNFNERKPEEMKQNCSKINLIRNDNYECFNSFSKAEESKNSLPVKKLFDDIKGDFF